jgi:glucose/arabinose dehydrogenase
MSGRALWTLLIGVVLAGCTRDGEPVVLPTASRTTSTQTIATGLPVPWGLGFLPDGTALVTLRDRGEVLHIAEGSAPVSVGRVPAVEPDGEG